MITNFLIHNKKSPLLAKIKFEPTFWFDSTPQGKFMLNIAFGQSKYYIDNLSESIKRGHRAKLRKGIWPNFAPLGYSNNSKTRAIDIDSEKHHLLEKHSNFTQLANAH